MYSDMYRNLFVPGSWYAYLLQAKSSLLCWLCIAKSAYQFIHWFLKKFVISTWEFES